MIKGLISLRGIFILFIFFHHCKALYPGGGSMAVAFFFVLGGFSMTLGYKDKVLQPEFNYRQYLTRRCIKFYPLHWLCLLAAVPLALFSFSWQQVPIFFVNAALLQTLVPIKDIYFSYNAVSWYLADTLFFAVLFPFLFKWIIRATPKGKTLFVAVLAAIYVLVSFFIPSEWRHAILYICPYLRTTDFVFGIFLALGYLKLKDHPQIKNKQNSIVINNIIVFVLIALLVVESCVIPKSVRMFAPIYWPLIALIILITSLSESNNNKGYNFIENKYFQRLGECSFTFFLIHQLILSYSTILFHTILHIDNKYIYVVFTLLLTIVMSLLVELYILKPITQWLTKRILPSTTVRS